MLLTKDHYLSLKNGMFDATKKTDLEHLFAALPDAAGHDNLVIHFHGGLVSMDSGLSTAEYLMEHLQDLEAYQIFFIWESGLLDVLSNSLNEISKEPVFQQLLMRIVQFATAKIGQQEGERGGRLELPDEQEVRDELHQPVDGSEPYRAIKPENLPQDQQLQQIEEEQFRETLEDDAVLEVEAGAIANSLRSPEEIQADAGARGIAGRGSRHTLMSPAVLDSIREEAPDPETRGLITTSFIINGAVSVLTRVIDRYAKRRAHGLYATIVEELLRQFYLANVGKAVWDQIKQNTVNAFGDDASQYGGTAFLQCLKDYYASGQRPHITLVGHSAGAIYICHLLKHVDAFLPDDITFDVIFLAPACSFQLFSEILAKYGHRITAIRVFGMSDQVEQADLLVPLVYPHSLLYLVSGIFEDDADTPLVGMQRYYSSEAPYDLRELLSVVDYLITPQTQRTVWSEVNGGNGLASSALKHGGFYQDDPTLESVRYIIERGF